MIPDGLVFCPYYQYFCLTTFWSLPSYKYFEEHNCIGEVRGGKHVYATTASTMFFLMLQNPNNLPQVIQNIKYSAIRRIKVNQFKFSL